jgi:tRNA modification GTPase
VKQLRSAEAIFALSSAPGRAGVAVIRVSGAGAAEALLALTNQMPEPRRATLATLRRPGTKEILDRGLVLWFPAPRSVTGENVAEFHVHGGRASVAAVLDALGDVDGLRPAEPGEFTRRAFEAGKMDLAETEALADLLDAETAAQRRQALRGLEHGIGRKAEAWRERLIEALALSEAEIDFPDEGDVPTGLISRAARIAQELSNEIAALLAEGAGGERLREGAVIVITGPPNVGKSSFLNRVAKRDVAIVSPHAGTTRDMLEVALDLGGYPATLIDTAGLRETGDPVEQEALRRARDRAAAADLVLWFGDASDSTLAEPPASVVPLWRILNKADLASTASAKADHTISALTGEGVDGLLSALAAWLRTELAPAESALITRARHRAALVEAHDHLARAARASAPELMAPELVAEELRLSARALGRISGRVDVETVLDAIFSSFCIGK